MRLFEEDDRQSHKCGTIPSTPSSIHADPWRQICWLEHQALQLAYGFSYPTPEGGALEVAIDGGLAGWVGALGRLPAPPVEVAYAAQIANMNQKPCREQCCLLSHAQSCNMMDQVLSSRGCTLNSELNFACMGLLQQIEQWYWSWDIEHAEIGLYLHYRPGGEWRKPRKMAFMAKALKDKVKPSHNHAYRANSLGKALPQIPGWPVCPV